MKQFIKSLLISLLVGVPVVIGAIALMYINTNRQPEESIEIHFTENTMELDQKTEEILTDETVSDEIIATTEIQAAENTENLVQPAEKESVTLSFAGDVHFSEQYIEKYKQNGISAFADEEMLRLMQNADLFMLNHEFVFSTRGEAMEDKEYTLRNDPQYVEILQDLGTDVVSIANNHILDFGQEAFLDTLDTLNNAEIAYAGGGRTLEEASAPVVQTIHGQTFAVFSATRVSPSYDWYASKNRPGIFQTYDAKALNAAILEAENHYDHTIVFVHWGIERNEMPEEYQRTLAKGYIDAGADLVIGCHPHVLQGFEYYEGVPIVYSLGNYLFGNRTGETLLLNANFSPDGELQIELIPCERSQGVLKRITAPETLFDHLTELSFGVSVSENGMLVP